MLLQGKNSTDYPRIIKTNGNNKKMNNDSLILTLKKSKDTHFILLKGVFLSPLSGLLHEQLFVVFELRRLRSKKVRFQLYSMRWKHNYKRKKKEKTLSRLQVGLLHNDDNNTVSTQTQQSCTCKNCVFYFHHSVTIKKYCHCVAFI